MRATKRTTQTKYIDRGLCEDADNLIFIGQECNKWCVRSLTRYSLVAPMLFSFKTKVDAMRAGEKIARAIGGKFYRLVDPRDAK